MCLHCCFAPTRYVFSSDDDLAAVSHKNFLRQVTHGLCERFPGRLRIMSLHANQQQVPRRSLRERWEAASQPLRYLFRRPVTR